jgi:hypothetical protein
VEDVRDEEAAGAETHMAYTFHDGAVSAMTKVGQQLAPDMSQLWFFGARALSEN